jgi:hypothetical protein
VMRHLPQTAWLRMNPYFADHVSGGDAGLYDLLLNPRDRAFDIPALHALLRGAGLRVACLMEPMRYDPATFLPDPKLRALADALDPVGRAALAEALCGNMSTHVVYCVRAGDPDTRPDPMAEDAVPVGREMPAPDIARNIRPDGMLGFVFDGIRVPVPLPALAPAILRLIDGKTSVGQIAGALAARGTDRPAFTRAWRATYAALEAVNRILLVPPP